MMSCTGNRGTISWQVILFLVTVTLQLVYPVVSLEESFCAGTGYHNLNYENEGPIRGYRTTGWDRLFAVNKPFTSYFWSVKAFKEDQTNVIKKEEIRFVRDAKGNPMPGWIYIAIKRDAFPFHYVAIWAVTQRNEVYGTFLFDERFRIRCPAIYSPYHKPYSFIPCSAGPANVDSVPNMFIYANLNRMPSGTSNHESFVEGKVTTGPVGENIIRLLWRSPPQSYCNRPQKFQFIFAYSPVKNWKKWADKWDGATRPLGGMWYEGNINSGPLIRKSAWIYPNYYGHPSNHDPSITLRCIGMIPEDRETWVKQYDTSNLDNIWYSEMVYPKNSIEKEGRFNDTDVILRSTCKGAHPATNSIQGFGGRCSKTVSPTERVTASTKAYLKCPDNGNQSGNVGSQYFKVRYANYLDKFKNMLKNECECTLFYTTNTKTGNNAVRSKSPTKKSLGGRSLSLMAEDRSRKGRGNYINKLIYKQVQDETQYTVSGYKRDHDVCSTDHVNLSQKAISDIGGVCMQTPVGKLVYGVRQWHGLTSLGVALVVTPMSIVIARYHKGDMILEDGQVKVGPWYVAHVLLLFPAFWMYASGIATMGRQTGVLGHSLTMAGKLHRAIGWIAISFIPVHVITGFLRPLNLTSRRVIIFAHWLCGIIQHLLEVLLCCTAYLIPASPTTSTSVFSSHFGLLEDSFESKMVLGWFMFNVLFHVFQTIRVKRRDCRNKIRSRSIFPVIIPEFSTFDEELIIGVEEAEPVIRASDVQDLWFERGALLVFGLVSGVVFVVAFVSLYQELHENLYYGFGPMSCTHTARGKFITPTRSNGSDDNHDKIDTSCEK